MYSTSKNILATAITLVCASTAYASVVPRLDLDTSFSSDGQHQQNYGITTGAAVLKSYFTDVAVTPDDKIIAVGHALRNSDQFEGIIVKYLADGSLDTSFDTDGIARHHTLSNTLLQAVAIQADGKILVAGRSRAHSGDWQLVVMRLNSNGSLDTGFANNGTYATRYSNPATTPVSRPTRGHLIPSDIGINSKGEIFISANQYLGQSFYLHRYLGHVIKLDSHGVLDTGFGYNGNNANNGDTRLVYRNYNEYSVEISKLTFDANDKMYVGGRWSYAGTGNPTTMFLQRIAADGKAVNQANPFSSAAYSRWSLADPRYDSNTDKQILNAAVVLPGGDIISAGCNTALTATPTRMQRQTPTGSFVSGFGTNGIAINSYNNSTDCFEDMNYHPTVGMVAVGNAGTFPFISSTHKNTGAHIESTQLTTAGTFKALATLGNGKIVAVGSTTGTIESLIAVFDGNTLTTHQTPTVSGQTSTSLNNIQLESEIYSITDNITITPTGPLSAHVIDGSVRINGSSQNQSGAITINDGDTVRPLHTTHIEPETETVTKLVIDRGTGFSHNNKSWKPTDSINTFKSTTLTADRTPDAFSLVHTGPTAGPTINSVTMSPTVTIAGINATVDVTISSGSGSVYSIKRDGAANAEGYTFAPGTIRAGDEITVRHTNSSSFYTTTSSTLTVGGVSATYTSRTPARDTLPRNFNLGIVGNTLGTNVLASVSGTINVSGINAPTPISIINGTYNINNGPYTAVAGTVNEGDQVRVRFTTSSLPSTAKTITLNIGGITDSVTHTTIAGDTTPDAFSFAVQTGVALSSTIISAPITVSGIDQNVQASIADGEMSVNGGSYGSNSVTVQDGDTIRVRHTSSSTVSDNTDSVLTVGGVTGTFTSVTTSSTAVVPSDTTPDAFSFAAQTDVALSTVISSAAVSIAGIDAATAITVTDGEYSLNGGSFTSAASTLVNGDTVTVRHTSSAQNSADITTQVNIGGVTSSFQTTTVAVGVTPTPTPEEPVKSSGGGSGGGSMNFLYLLAAGLLFNRKRKS